MREWLRLVRAPNLATAVADVIAGAALSGADLSALPTVVTALGSAAIYAAGVALNDLADVEKDRRLHPGRPLVTGAIGRGHARTIILLLFGFGLASGLACGVGPAVMAAALITAVALYDGLPESAGPFAAIVMGTCRALNLGRGVLLANQAEISNVALAAIGLHFLLIAHVTWVSQGEDGPGHPAARRWARLLFPWYLVPFLALIVSGQPLAGAIPVLLGGTVLGCFVVLPMCRPDTPAAAVVPRAVLTLTLLDALWCVGVGRVGAATGLILLHVAARIGARRLVQLGS